MKINFFDIKSVAIIGASETEGKIGNDLLKNLKEFKGKKYGINPKGGSFEKIIFYKSVPELPKIPDIAVIVIPATFVVDTLMQCGEKGIKRIIIISAGFKESGNIDGEKIIKEIAEKYDIKILGPNCLGYIDAHKKLNLSFGGRGIKPGNIAMISQSGAMAVALTDWAETTHLGFSKLISMGNKADLNENELLEYLENDKKTKVIVIYLESIEQGKRFYEIAKNLSKTKPIIMVKSGLSERGQKAANSHTGALSGENKVLETMYRDAGIHTTSSIEDFFLWAEIFSKTIKHNIPEKLTIITNAGGPGVMTTDHCETNNILLIEFNEKEKIKLKKKMPDSASMNNPIDIIGDATSVRYKQILKNIKSLGKNIGIISLITPQTVTDINIIAKEIYKWEKENQKYFFMTSFMGGKSVEQARKYLRENNVLDYDYPKKGLVAYSKLLEQKKWKKIPIEKKASIYKISKKEKDSISRYLKKDELLCSTKTISKIFKAFKIQYLKDKLVDDYSGVDFVWNNKKEDKLVAKISSKDIPHKTDCGGVVVGISTLEEAHSAYKNILKNVKKSHKKAEISGVIFQEMLPSSKEVFIGMKRDVSFGEILIVGMGGIYVNVYEDINMKIAPINKSEIKTMFESLKGFPILNGARGNKKVKLNSIIDIVSKIQSIFHTFPEIKEIDINPAFVNEKGSIIVDAKFYL